MSAKRSLQHLKVISKCRRNSVILPKLATQRYYATRNKKIEASMGGIFEPFLNENM